MNKRLFMAEQQLAVADRDNIISGTRPGQRLRILLSKHLVQVGSSVRHRLAGGARLPRRITLRVADAVAAWLAQ